MAAVDRVHHNMDSSLARGALAEPDDSGIVRLPRAQEATLNIGQLLSHLSVDFPDVTASKVRFWEEKGLISPRRTPSGYRKYSAADVERIRFILSAQRDQYLPLRVIKRYLDSIDAGIDPEDLGIDIPQSLQVVPDRYVTLVYLKEHSGASESLIRALISSKLLVPVRGADGQARYAKESLGVVKAAKQLEGFGIEPRHLHVFRTFIEREISLLERALASRKFKKSDSGDAKVGELSEEIQESYRNLHNWLLQVHTRKV